jgi:hypothetical protein
MSCVSSVGGLLLFIVSRGKKGEEEEEASKYEK